MKYAILFILFIFPYLTSESSNNTFNDNCYYLNKLELTYNSKYNYYNKLSTYDKYINTSNIITKFSTYDFKYDTYLSKLSYYESRGNYKAINKYTNCLGKYQFKKSTIDYLVKTNSLNYNNKITKDAFLNSNELQEAAILSFTYRNLITLEKRGLLSYVGKTIDGTEITISGLLAASHLGGVGGLNKYLTNKKDSMDIHGTRISKYLKLMQ